MALNVGVDASFGNISDWEGIWGKADEMTGTKADVSTD
jgi:hypothetical protein